MSFGGAPDVQQPPAPKALGVPEERTASNEAGRPVPYLAGRNRIGLIWLCEPFGVRTVAVTSQTGGKGSRTIHRGYNYFASFAGLVCHGPVDGISKIYFNNEEVWSGSVTRSGDSTNLTVEGFGTATIYWGTATQTADATLTGSGQAHPAYRRQCYILFPDFLLGFNQTNLPNVEVVVSRYPDPSWMDADETIDGEANPIGVLADLLQSEVYGLGLPDASLDTDGLDAVATELASEGLGISPVITRLDSAANLVRRILEIIDGYRFWDGDGKLNIGLIREPDTVSVTIDEDDLVEPPDIAAADYSEVRTVTHLNFISRDRAWTKDYLSYRDPRSREGLGLDEPANLDRLWITDPDVAANVVAAAGRSNALPPTTGSLQVLRSSAASLVPGSPFYLSYARHGISSLLCRVMRIRSGSPEARSVTLEFRVDRAWLNTAADYYQPTPPTPATPGSVSTEPFARQDIYEPPFEICGERVIHLVPLAARPTAQCGGYDIHVAAMTALANSSQVLPGAGASTILDGSLVTPLDNVLDTGLYTSITVDFTFGGGEEAALVAAADADELILQLIQGARIETFVPLGYEEISADRYTFIGYRARSAGVSAAWAGASTVRAIDNGAAVLTRTFTRQGDHDRLYQYGTLQATYVATTGILDTTVGMDILLEEADTTLASLSLDEASRNRTLILVGDEIISMTSVSLIAAGRYRVYGIRGRFDSRPVEHASGTPVWIVPDAHEADTWWLKRVGGAPNTGSGVQYKLQPRFLGTLEDLADCPPINHTVDARCLKPRAPRNLAAAGDGRHPTYSTGEDIALTWDLTVPTGLPYRQPFWAAFAEEVVSGYLPQVRIEVYTTGGTLKNTYNLARGLEAWTYTNAALIADFGTEQDVVFRIYGREGGWVSLFYDELTVEFV